MRQRYQRAVTITYLGFLVRDLEIVAENTKITWASSTPVFPFKPRDFCTIVHTRRLQDGTYVVLNRAVTHPEAPVNNKFVRGAIVLGANIIRPIKDNPKACELTMITQVDPGGFAPPMILNHVSVKIGSAIVC